MRIFILGLCLVPTLLFSANITNAIEGVGPNGSVKPWLCIQNKAGAVTLSLAPGKSGDGNRASGNNYYVGAVLRFGGCTPENSYLGYANIALSSTGNNAITSYLPPDSVHVAWQNPSISSSGRVGGAIQYTAIDTNPNFAKGKSNAYWLFAGFNLSGLEFGKSIDPVVIPNLSEIDAESALSDLKETQTMINSGMNTIRLPVRWGYLQLDGPGKGVINQDYYNNYIRPNLQTLTQAGIYTIVDLHAYMRYSKFGEQYAGCGADGACPDGTLILDEKAYQSVWGQLYELIDKDETIDKNFIMLDLVNEPVAVPDDKVFTIQASVINFLRAKGFKGYILVEGNSWSGLHSWTTESWNGADGQSYTNASLFTREHFAKAGIQDLSRILINVHQYLDSNFSGTQDDCQQDLTTTGSNGFNLNAFSDYLAENQLHAIVTEFGAGRNSASCQAPLNQFMQYLQDNSANNKDHGFVGWTIWSTGHGWGNYNLRVKPDSYQMRVLSDYLG